MNEMQRAALADALEYLRSPSFDFPKLGQVVNEVEQLRFVQHRRQASGHWTACRLLLFNFVFGNRDQFLRRQFLQNDISGLLTVSGPTFVPVNNFAADREYLQG